MTLIDAGPLVALFRPEDAHHLRCRRFFRTLVEPPATVWPVVTEAMYLLSYSWKAQDALAETLETGAVFLLTLEDQDIPRLRQLMRKYQDLPMDFADAALVCAAENRKISRVFTLDVRDFRIYTARGVGRFEVLP